MELRVTYISSALWTLLGSPFAFADIACDKSYGLRVDVSGRTGVVICDSSSESFVDSINDFKRSIINYTKTSAVSAFGRFNDVDLALSYAARSTKLVYAFPQLGDAEIQHFGVKRAIELRFDHDVVGLQISVDDSSRVRRGNG